MDKPIRKFVLYKCRNIEQMRKKLAALKERRREIIDETSSVMDGQPKAKYSKGDVVGSKVVRMEQLDFKIQKLEYEIKTILDTRDLLDDLQKQIYDETIMKYCDIQAKADFLFVDRTHLIKTRGKILRLIASRLGEYVDDDEEGR